MNEFDPNNCYRIRGEGSGGVAGFAKGGARVHLQGAGLATVLTCEIEAQIGGKLAQLGSRLITGVVNSMAEKFFTRLVSKTKQDRARAYGRARARRVTPQYAKIADRRRGPAFRTGLGLRRLDTATCQQPRYNNSAGSVSAARTWPRRERLPSPSSRQFVLRFCLKITGVVPLMQLA